MSNSSLFNRKCFFLDETIYWYVNYFIKAKYDEHQPIKNLIMQDGMNNPLKIMRGINDLTKCYTYFIQDYEV